MSEDSSISEQGPTVEATFTSCVLGERKPSFGHSMKRDSCSEVRATSVNRMHSVALLRNWSKLGKSASISIHRRLSVMPRLKVGPALLDRTTLDVEIGRDAT